MLQKFTFLFNVHGESTKRYKPKIVGQLKMLLYIGFYYVTPLFKYT